MDRRLKVAQVSQEPRVARRRKRKEQRDLKRTERDVEADTDEARIRKQSECGSGGFED